MAFIPAVLARGFGRHRGFLDPMTAAEAVKVLALGRGWSNAEVNANYRALLLKNHPDRGGSEYLAQKLNEARELLLSRPRSSWWSRG